MKNFFKKKNFIPRPCEYYLHFNANLPYPDNVNLSNLEYK